MEQHQQGSAARKRRVPPRRTAPSKAISRVGWRRTRSGKRVGSILEPVDVEIPVGSDIAPDGRQPAPKTAARIQREARWSAGCPGQPPGCSVVQCSTCDCRRPLDIAFGSRACVVHHAPALSGLVIDVVAIAGVATPTGDSTSLRSSTLCTRGHRLHLARSLGPGAQAAPGEHGFERPGSQRLPPAAGRRDECRQCRPRRPSRYHEPVDVAVCRAS
jgi:hypothetical protein